MHYSQLLNQNFENLDRKIGNSSVLYVLTSDHGVIELPEYLNEKGITSGRIPSAVRDSIIAKTLIIKITFFQYNL